MKMGELLFRDFLAWAEVVGWRSQYRFLAGPWRLPPRSLLLTAAVEPDDDGAPFLSWYSSDWARAWSVILPFWPGRRLHLWWYRLFGIGEALRRYERSSRGTSGDPATEAT
jgi:hypothetical protein